MITAVELSQAAAALLARSLAVEKDARLERGLQWPAELDELYLIAVRSARSGQLVDRSGQSSHDPADGCDGGLMDMGSASRKLGVSERTLRRLRAAGDIPTVQVGARKLFRQADLDAYIEERAQ